MNEANPPITKRNRYKILLWLAGLATLGLLLASLAVTLVIREHTKDLPSTDQLTNYDPAVVTRLYAADGKLLAEYAKEKRFFLPLSAIPKHVQQAFVSAEDRNFYFHKGVDIWGVLRAVRENLVNLGSGKAMVGGSTITQQVVKNFLLTSEKSFARKVREAILAYRISNTYSKDKILELYLNEIYLGRGTYGVAAAAVDYFNKSLDALTTEEAALLAAMPKAPAAFDPAKNYQRALERRNYVINRMREDGYIDAKEADRARATAIITRPRDKGEVTRADFFAEEVRRNLATMYGSRVLYEGGLFVKTTVNPDFQTYADQALRHALMMYDRRHGYRGPIATLKNDTGGKAEALERIRGEKNIPIYGEQQLAAVEKVDGAVDIALMDGTRGSIPPEELTWIRPHKLAVGDVVLTEPAAKKGEWRLLQIPQVNGALVAMDPHTGKVLALSGGYSYSGSEFNRATQAKRQPGSAFKPFVYLTALESGLSPASVLLDAPVSMSQGEGLPLWTPKNYQDEYLGPITLRTALEKSRNTVTVRIAQIIGLKRITRLARRLNIYGEKEAFNYSMVLGAQETTLLRLTNAYAMVANGGRRVEPWLIERIDDRNGITIFRRDTRLCEMCKLAEGTQAVGAAPTLSDERERVIDPRVAYQLTSILKGVMERGTGTAAKVLGRPIAGKTGTTNESRDTWFIGYTPDIVVGTYVGFDTPKPMGDKETGGRVAIQGFIKFMQLAASAIPTSDFRAPPGIREVPVNRVNGQPLYEGQAPEGVAVIREAFLTGGAIFKPANELEEELKERPLAPPPEAIGTPIDGFSAPGAGEMAPYQRPVDAQGFDPSANAPVGTGGLY